MCGGGAVSRVLCERGNSSGRSSIWDDGRPSPQAAYPRLKRSGLDLAAYLALLQLGVTVPLLLPGRAVGSYPTFSPLPTSRWAVCFLWPCPSPHGAQALPGSLPCGARTFLDPLCGPRPSHPTTKCKILVRHGWVKRRCQTTGPSQCEASLVLWPALGC